MKTLSKPLLALTAADLMSEDLVMIPKEMSLQTAARLLSQHQVSGAPVINEDGICIGVLSATDFIHWAEDHKIVRDCPLGEICQPWQMVEPKDLPHDLVENYMTRQPVTVSPNKNITELARMMIDAHIHRVIIVNEEGRPQGIVAATDILAAIAYANPYTQTSTS